MGGTCGGSTFDTVACGAPQLTLLALGAPLILMAGGLWAFSPDVSDLAAARHLVAVAGRGLVLMAAMLVVPCEGMPSIAVP